MDTSASMHGGPIESVKTALLEAISNLDPMDSFNIIAFNEGTALFSLSMECATHEIIEKAAKWIDQSTSHSIFMWLDIFDKDKTKNNLSPCQNYRSLCSKSKGVFSYYR